MADQSKSKRTSFIGKRLGLGRLVGKSSTGSSSNNHASNSASATAAASPANPSNTPNRAKKKTRSARGTRQKTPSDLSNMDDIEPSARALQKQQSQQQLLQKQLSTKSMNASGSTSRPSMQRQASQRNRQQQQSAPQQQQQQSPPTIQEQGEATTTPSGNGGGTGMRQRLQELQAMIAANKDEMEQLKAAECVKLQAVVRGWLVRRQRRSLKESPKPTKTKTAPSSPKPPPMATRKTSTNTTSSTTPKRKRKKVKSAKESAAKTKATTEDWEKRKAAIQIQALVRGFCQRQRTKKLASKAKHAQSKKDKKGDATTTSKEHGPDHYAWDQTEEDGGDHYAWNQGGDNNNNNKTKDAAAASPKKEKGKTPKATNAATNTTTTPHHHHHHHKRRSLTKDQTNAIKNGSKQKAKSRRVNSLKPKDNHEMTEYSWKDHSTTMMKDASHPDQSMPDHSMPFQELIVDANNKDSSGSITNPGDVSQTVLEEEEEHDQEIFEDSDDDDSDKDVHSSTSAHTSKQSRSSVASSFVSKLTEIDEEEDNSTFGTNEDGSLTSKEWSDALASREVSDDEDEEPDLLDLSVMATAAMKQQHAALTERDIGREKTSRRRRRRRRNRNQQDPDDDEDDLSVSIMAVSPKRSEGSDTEDGDLTDDESVASYAYQTDKDFDDSVMAVAEVSDLEDVESEFELEDYETEYEEEDYDDDDADYEEDDMDDDLSDTVMAVALDDDEFDDENDDASVAFNPREDDMSITSIESNLPREQTTRDHRRRRRHEVDEDGDEIIEAEDVSVLSTASNKRHKRNNHNHQRREQQRAKRESKKSTSMLKPKAYDNQFLLPQYPSDSSEEESYLERKRRQRRSRRSMTKKGKKPFLHHQHVDPEDEEELQRKLAEVNQLIAESRKEMEELMEAEATKIQAFYRMHQERKMMDSSGRSVPEIRNALSRTGTKEMNSAAATIQALIRGCQARADFDAQRRSRKRSRRHREKKQRRARELEQKAVEQERQLQERLVQVELEMKRHQAALEKQKATNLQAVIRGFLVRSKDLLNPKRLAAIKMQRFVRSALRVVHLRKRLVTIAEERVKQVQDVLDNKKKSMTEFEPGKFDNMDTRVKMVNFLKKQIEKENEATEKLVAKIKTVKENNVRLMTSNSSSVCTVERLRMDVQAKEEKRDTMVKLNQQWIDGIKEYENRVEAVVNNTKTQKWQQQCCQKYINLIADTMEARYPVKKLVKEIKFLANHSDAAA